ncbi:MAG: class I SAM-dependent methyltransferase, partial [Chloroflexota bacterium]
MRVLLRIFFRLLYNELAITYDLISWVVSIGQWREWQRQTIPFIIGDQILEVAHGTGNLQIDLISKGYRPTAFDLSAQMGHIASHKLKRHSVTPPFARGMVQHLPFVGAHFTSIVSTFPTEFIIDPNAVKEFNRVLISGGRLIFVPSATIVPKHLLDRFARWLFDVTGQAVGDTVLWEKAIRERYESANFEIKIENVSLPR